MGDNLEPVNLGTVAEKSDELHKALKAVAGHEFTCVLRDDFEVVCFGHNDRGQLGVEDDGDVGKYTSDMGDNLVPVNFGQDSGYAVDISSGPCALLSTGKVKVGGTRQGNGVRGAHWQVGGGGVLS